MDAGAEDYLNAYVARRELGTRIDHHLRRGKLAQGRRDTDPLTGTANRTTGEHSLDCLLRLAARHHEPFSFALITVDQDEQIRHIEGTAFGDIVLRRLGARLVEEFRGSDIVARWTRDGFAVGMYGTAADDASRRITAVLHAFGDERFTTTSGGSARCTFSAGVASSPTDGSNLSSLAWVSETALQRGKVGQNCVVIAGERRASHAPDVFDVILVEDDDSVADVIEHALRLGHHDFLRFSDGAEAALALGERHVRGRVVLLDVGLPSLDGFGVLQVMRAQGIMDDTRVIMLTARSSEAEMLRALGLGATEHINKPFSLPVLLGRLDQTLSKVAA